MMMIVNYTNLGKIKCIIAILSTQQTAAVCRRTATS